MSVPVVPLKIARQLFLAGHGLLGDPSAPAPARLSRTAIKRTASIIEMLGFVQIDSINVVERAHHHIIWARWHSYRPPLLDALLRERVLFEHWTHDASLIPTRWFPHWRHRFERYRETSTWMRDRLGPDAPRIVSHVLERIRTEGPLMSKDFEEPKGKSGGWWDWKPQKAALEHLWRTGELSVAGRLNFHKIYDLTLRVLPEAAALPRSTDAEHIEWACSTAMERLIIATPREVASFWAAISFQKARQWCDAAAREGRIVPVQVDGSPSAPPHHAFALADWQTRAGRLPVVPRSVRLLSPFDPIIRDRRRALRLFDFDYRFEAFVPAPKRQYGYYTLPVLQGDRLVARIDPRLDRKPGTLDLRIWWEPGVKPSRARKQALDEAVTHYASFVGATTWNLHNA